MNYTSPLAHRQPFFSRWTPISTSDPPNVYDYLNDLLLLQALMSRLPESTVTVPRPEIMDKPWIDCNVNGCL